MPVFALLANAHFTFGQNKIKLEKVTPESFTINSPLIDTNANAIVLKDIGSSTFEGNDKGWFTLVYTRARQVKILNKKGFDEANVTISLYRSNSQEEELGNVKAVTYNLANGKVKETQLERKSIFKEKFDKNYTLAKFPCPKSQKIQL